VNVLLSIILAFFSIIASAEEIQPFTSDGCSSFPNGTITQEVLWLSCCTEHDKAYWQGGSYQQRLDADIELKRCVAAVGEPVIAELMLSGVRVGGSPYWPTQFRWGYGYSYPHGYVQTQSLSSSNLFMVLFTSAFIAFIALLHCYFLVLEMFLWDKPLGRKTFKLSADTAKASKNLAANQGLYNGFLAAGLVWGLLLGSAGIAILVFFLSCIVIAGIFGGFTVSKRIFFIQALPAIMALILLFIS